MSKELDDLRYVTLAQVGLCLLSCQQLERSLSPCIEHWFPVQEGLELLDRLQGKKYLSKATLGVLIGRIKKYRSVASNFDDELRDILERRNHFVHHFADGFEFDHAHTLIERMLFAQKLREDALRMAAVFFAVAREVAETQVDRELLPEQWKKDPDSQYESIIRYQKVRLPDLLQRPNRKKR